MTTLRAFHGDPFIKDKYLSRVMAHRAADEIVHGYYWEQGKGCAVGCTVHGPDHAAYERELGIPRALARLEDRIFEGMGNGDAKDFPVQFLSAIKPGADLSLVVDKFLYWLLGGGQQGEYIFSDERARESCAMVRDLYGRKLNGERIDLSEWHKARDAAYTAYAAADAAAADAATTNAAYTAYTAADATNAAAAAYAANAATAAYAAAATTTRSKAFATMRVKLLELLASAE